MSFSCFFVCAGYLNVVVKRYIIKIGKKRMRQLGTVAVPQEAFMSVLKLDD